MIGTVVYKMTGSGNDFVFVDGRPRGPGAWTAEQIRTLCDRQRGVGADGFVVVEPGSAPNAVRFHFFNRDGGRAAMCGNGALCATRIAGRLELASPAGMLLETDAGAYRSRCLDGPGELAELVLEEIKRTELARAIEVDALAAELGVPFMTMSDALDRLARSGDVESDPNPADRRPPVFSLTAAGLERYRASRPALERALAALERANGGRVDGLHAAVAELDDALRRVEP